MLLAFFLDGGASSCRTSKRSPTVFERRSIPFDCLELRPFQSTKDLRNRKAWSLCRRWCPSFFSSFWGKAGWAVVFSKCLHIIATPRLSCSFSLFIWWLRIIPWDLPKAVVDLSTFDTAFGCRVCKSMAKECMAD